MDNIEQRKVSETGIKLGVILITNGEQFLRNYFKVSPKMSQTKNEFSEWISENIFKGESLWDEKFYFESIDFWNSLMQIWWGQKKQYIVDTFDCDNFARHFQSSMSLYFGLNSAGVASGSVYNSITGKFISRHAFNVIVVEENGSLKPYLFEPMDNAITPWTGQKTHLGNWLYEIDWIDFN